jgi:predicted nucleotidyltransferase
LPVLLENRNISKVIDSAIIDSCIKRFAKESNLMAVWILGSAVTDRLRDDSDVDFALYYRPGSQLDLAAYGQLVLDLERILGRTVDLGRLSSRNVVYAVQATQNGKLIFAPDPQEAIAFASRMQSLYLDLKQDRKIVEEAYCA